MKLIKFILSFGIYKLNFYVFIKFCRVLISEENKILDTLSTDDNLLEHDAGVQLISSSKMQINELFEKLGIAKATEKQIDISRLAYKSFAEHATIIYFTIGNNTMYLSAQSFYTVNNNNNRFHFR